MILFMTESEIYLFTFIGMIIFSIIGSVLGSLAYYWYKDNFGK